MQVWSCPSRRAEYPRSFFLAACKTFRHRYHSETGGRSYSAWWPNAFARRAFAKHGSDRDFVSNKFCADLIGASPYHAELDDLARPLKRKA